MSWGRNRHANEFMRTCWGRLAGNGMNEDRYDEESGPGNHLIDWYPTIREPKEEIIPGEVTTYKLTLEEMEALKEKWLK